MMLKNEVETYAMHARDLEKVDWGLVDWMEADEMTRDMKVESARKID